MHSCFLLALALAGLVTAKQIVITVGYNTTDDADKVFQPASVVAQQGDTVYFNFTLGNHTAIQSTFSSPCIPVHDTNTTVNGFISGFRNAGNGQAITNLPVVVQNPNTTIWFFDYNTCAQGGVGGININDSSSETLEGFQRNAIRLNGSTPSSTSSTIATTATTASIPTKSSSDAERVTLGGATIALSFLIVFSWL
ncbi:hypothetical protein L208DRAFT_1402737 [Tricholoma matsutake]|nr:hypothetical protein L208DRAFT_1402737 [Tricholoma matsutake 945]